MTPFFATALTVLAMGGLFTFYVWAIGRGEEYDLIERLALAAVAILVTFLLVGVVFVIHAGWGNVLA